MKMLAVILVLSLVVSLAAIGCGSGMKTYTQSDTNITASIGDQFVIQLESNPTTGFQWGISGSLNPTVVKKVSSKYVPGKNAQTKVGAGGVENWTFQAMAKGTTKIVMTYARPFEKGTVPAQTVTFNVTVD